jgi:hypothetical protein
MRMTPSAWPDLDYAASAPTLRALHLFTQIVGKARLSQTPWLNHSWSVPLYVSPRGLTTGLVPHGDRTFDVEFDLTQSVLRARTEADASAFGIAGLTVATFHKRFLDTLRELGVPVTIDGAPNELPEATPFRDDTAPRAYDPALARTFHRALLTADRILKTFRTGFLGKASPTHFFWGSFDLAVTRFSGRRAPPHPGGIPHLPDAVAREAYSHEVSSAGFWPGGPGCEEAVFYSYAYPEPPGFREARLDVAGARFDATLGEYVLPWAAARVAADPEAAVMAFLQATYAAAADNAEWDREGLECGVGEAGRVRGV